MVSNTRTEWAKAYHTARIGIRNPPMVRPHGVARRTWRLAVALVLWRGKHGDPMAQYSKATRRTFEAISDPRNAHLFTVDAACKAFARVVIH